METFAGQAIALIGDLVASRSTEAPRRREIQQQLTDHFADLPPGTGTGIASQPLLTLGDEFQALFTADEAGAHAVMVQMATIAELARPVAVRFGLGIGELTTDLKPQALGMDGPCFHRARAALKCARDTDVLCRLETGTASADALWSTLASYALRERTGWTAPQREAIALYEKFGAWNKVADALNVTRGAVSLRQRAAGWALYRDAWIVLEHGLAQMTIERGEHA